MAKTVKTIEERILAKVIKTESCWIWTGSVNSAGRPTMTVGSRTDGSRKVEIVYRAYWREAKGPLSSKTHLCHSCDNPLCINLEHLFKGNHLINMRDMVKKKRNHRGEDRPNAKLTWGAVETIRAAHARGQSAPSLAKAHGVCTSTIVAAVQHKTWKK